MVSQFALAQLEDVKKYLRIPDATTSEDDLLEILIDSSTEQIEQWCKRKFKSREYEDEDFDGTDSDSLLLHEWPIVSVSALNIDYQRAFGVNTAIDVATIAISAEEGKITLNPSVASGSALAAANFPRGIKNVRVTYEAGYATIPGDLKLACMKLVAIHFGHSREGGDGVASESIGGHAIAWVDGLPKTISEMLSAYKRVGGA